MTEAYRPIDCSLHDRIEDLAVRRTLVRIWHESDAGPVDVHDTIADWLVRDGVEYVRTGSGVEIRMDRLLEIDGVRYR